MKDKDIESVAIYARVSTDKQKAKQTIDSQLSTLPKYAEENDYKVVETYVDDGLSGSTIQGRPAFSQLLEDCAKGIFQAILVVEHNRLTRSDNPEEVGKIQRIFMENNIRIISPPEGVIDLRKPPDELVSWIKTWISKEERKEIVRKIGRGRIESWRKGKWAAGKYPLGYRRKEKSDEGEVCCAIRLVVNRFSIHKLSSNSFRASTSSALHNFSASISLNTILSLNIVLMSAVYVTLSSRRRQSNRCLHS